MTFGLNMAAGDRTYDDQMGLASTEVMAVSWAQNSPGSSKAALLLDFSTDDVVLWSKVDLVVKLGRHVNVPLAAVDQPKGTKVLAGVIAAAGKDNGLHHASGFGVTSINGPLEIQIITGGYPAGNRPSRIPIPK